MAKRRKAKKSGTKARKRKWGSPKQKAAFARMIAARGSSSGSKSRRSNPSRKKRSKRKARRAAAASRRPTTLVLVTPGGGKPAKRKRRSNPTMAKRRRKNGRRSAARRRNNPGAVTSKKKRFRRRRNPGGSGGIMSLVTNTVKTGVPAMVGGAVSGLVDTKFLKDASPLVRVLSKVALAAGAAKLLRSRPATAYAVMGSILGAAGYDIGVNIGGGMVAKNKAEVAKKVDELYREDPATMSALLNAYGTSIPAITGTSTDASAMGASPVPDGVDLSTISLG